MRPAVCVFGAACAAMLIGQGSAADAQTLVAQPCALLSQAEAAAINGGPVAPGQALDVPGPGKECLYAGVGSDGTVMVAEIAPVMMAGMTTAQIFDLAERGASGTVEPLSGLGDAAYYESSSGTFDLWVLAGQVMLDVDASPAQAQTPDPGREALMEAAARTALKGL